MIQLYSYTIDMLWYTEEQLQWLETHVQVFEAAVLEGQHFNWLETFLVDWFKRWPKNPNGIYYEDEEEEDRLARKKVISRSSLATNGLNFIHSQGILWHLTMWLGHSWSLDAETGTKESKQIKFDILEYLHQFNDKALVTKVMD